MTLQPPFSSWNHGPEVSSLVLSPLTTDLCGANSPLKGACSTDSLGALSQQAPLQKEQHEENQRFKSSVLEINVHFVFRFKEAQQNRGWEIERTEQKVLHA